MGEIVIAVIGATLAASAVVGLFSYFRLGCVARILIREKKDPPSNPAE